MVLEHLGPAYSLVIFVRGNGSLSMVTRGAELSHKFVCDPARRGRTIGGPILRWVPIRRVCQFS